jgi:hypothetical protein
MRNEPCPKCGSRDLLVDGETTCVQSVTVEKDGELTYDDYEFGDTYNENHNPVRCAKCEYESDWGHWPDPKPVEPEAGA